MEEPDSVSSVVDGSDRVARTADSRLHSTVCGISTAGPNRCQVSALPTVGWTAGESGRDPERPTQCQIRNAATSAESGACGTDLEATWWLAPPRPYPGRLYWPLTARAVAKNTPSPPCPHNWLCTANRTKSAFTPHHQAPVERRDMHVQGGRDRARLAPVVPQP
jgi:hypothetical protein